MSEPAGTERAVCAYTGCGEVVALVVVVRDGSGVDWRCGVCSLVCGGALVRDAGAEFVSARKA